jgi:hypothetical protein
VIGIERDLGVGETQRCQSRSRVDLIATPVGCLLGWGAVVAEAVGFDYQPELGPVEVDLAAVHPCACLGQVQACPPGQGQETPLELRVGEPEGVPVQYSA